MKNSDFIPFVGSSNDLGLAERHFKDASIRHVSITAGKSTLESVPSRKLWLHTGFEMYHKWPKDAKAAKSHPFNRLSCFQHHEIPTLSKFSLQKHKDSLKEFVEAVLDDCKSRNPAWLSVPQLAYVKGAGKNKINKYLADCTKDWVTEKNYKGKLVLPVILTHANQTDSKPERAAKIKTLVECYRAADADLVWIIDAHLDDQSGAQGLDTKRFKPLIDFHMGIRKRLIDAEIIGGPYWGLNLILWARGLIDYCGVPLNSTMRFFLPGPIGPSSGKNRVAVKSLRRLLVADPHLKDWLSKSINELDAESEAHEEMEELLETFANFTTKEYARNQVVQFYREWIDLCTRHPAPGRALALFQDLSNAYAIGRSLPNLKTAKPRQPERVAQPLMLSCL